MALRGIDIASHQAGLDITAVDCDFVIVKATQGTSYVNPYCASWVDKALARGLCVGIYHYISGGNATGEMNYFYQQCKGWDGRVMWCLDWESYQNSAWGNTSYLDSCIKRLAALTGKAPMVYASSSAFPWTVADSNNCGRWVAQYASNSTTGYQDSPWNEGAYSCAMRQYSSAGRISGWSGNLDLNKFYGDESTWQAYVTGGKTSDTEEEDMTSEQAAQLAEIYNQVTRTDDCSGRGVVMNDHDHIKWMASKQAEMKESLDEVYYQVTRTDDCSGRETNCNDHDHIKWMAAKQEKMDKKLDAICAALNLDLDEDEEEETDEDASEDADADQ